MKPQIYDCFCFRDELDILEMRLNILDKYIDKFILTEARYTKSGKRKELNFLKNMKRFSQFKDKIIYQTLDKFPDISQFERSRYQGNYAHKIIDELDENTLIMSGDVDEIVDPKILEGSLKLATESGKMIVFEQKMCYYFLNVQTGDLHSAAGEKENWFGTRLCENKFFSQGEFTIDDLRHKKATQEGIVIKNGGWHFSHQGGIEHIIKKIESSAHQEYNNAFIKGNIKNAMDAFDSGYDLYHRKAKFKVVSLEDYPEYILNNKEKYNHMIKEY